MKLKLLARNRRKTSPSVSKRGGGSRRIIFLLFGCGLVFFVLSFLLYQFQYLIPHISSSDKHIIRPDGTIKKDASFEEALRKNNIQFDSVKLATESPTLIVKLPNDSYVYMDATRDPASQIKLLASILSRMDIEKKDKKLKYVDLRFEKAIVKF